MVCASVRLVGHKATVALSGSMEFRIFPKMCAYPSTAYLPHDMRQAICDDGQNHSLRWGVQGAAGIPGLCPRGTPGIAGRGLFVRFLAFRDEAALQ